MTGTVMQQGSGKHTISMKMGHPTREQAYAMCGVVRDGQACDEIPSAGGRDNTTAWFMFSADGSLCGNGKQGDVAAGQIENGHVLTIQVDLDAGTLKFWVDGQPHDPGWATEVMGPLRWAVSRLHTGTSVEIVPNPELQPWTEWEPLEEKDY